MKVTIDAAADLLTVHDGDATRTLPVYSDEGFELLTQLWVKVGWNQRYSYMFSWFGRPIIQLPEDMVRIQEVIWDVKPDVIIETGVAHGGSLIYYASLFQAMGVGRVVGIDIDIRPHNREAIEAHPLAHRISLIQGSSIAPEVVAEARAHVKPGDKVMVILDSNHCYDHVAAELEAYADFVTPGSYLVATDGVMKDLHDCPRGQAEWITDNPTRAAADFAAQRSDFVLGDPPRPFCDSGVKTTPTHWPGAWLRKA